MEQFTHRQLDLHTQLHNQTQGSEKTTYNFRNNVLPIIQYWRYIWCPAITTTKTSDIHQYFADKKSPQNNNKPNTATTKSFQNQESKRQDTVHRNLSIVIKLHSLTVLRVVSPSTAGLVPNMSRHLRVSFSGISLRSFIGDCCGLKVRTTKLSCWQQTPSWLS